MRSNDAVIRQAFDAMDVCIAKFGLMLDEMDAKDEGVDPATLGVAPCMICGSPALNNKDDVWGETLCRRCRTEEKERRHSHEMGVSHKATGQTRMGMVKRLIEATSR